jgi:hypothetical protein
MSKTQVAYLSCKLVIQCVAILVILLAPFVLGGIYLINQLDR